MIRTTLTWFFFAAFILLSIAPSRTEPNPTQQPNILLITIDTLRADRLGCYGYSQAQTPVLDRLATEGVLFTNAVSHVPLTRPSHASIFTGLYPYEHGIHDNVAPPLDSKIPTLAEILQKRGYATAAFIAAFILNSQSGLQRGFDLYADEFDPQKQPTQFALNLEKRGDQVYREFHSWLSWTKRRPYFAWIHLYDPHFPYSPPSSYASRFGERPYDGEVAYSDHIIGKILKHVDQNTLLVVTSDHGESLGEHQENAHSFFIYDATLHVPLIVRWPGTIPASRKVKSQVRSIDLFPTILDFLNVPVPQKISGVSLKPQILKPESAAPFLPSYCETFTPWLHFGWSKLQGVRWAGWKYIEAPRTELYELEKDPREMKNMASAQPGKVKELQQWLAKSGALEKGAAPVKTPDIDPETLEKLASLGYAGTAPPPTPPGTKLADPKDKIADFQLFNKLIREGIEAFQQERYQEAASKFQELRNKEIPSFEVHYYLGRSLLRLKSYDKCRTELEFAIRRLPHFLPAYRDLSEAWEGLGNLREAEKALQAGLLIAPNHPVLVQPLAWMYQRQKRYPAAEKLLLSELKEHPEDVQALFRLGAVYRDTGRANEAIQQFQRILEAKPDDAEAYNQLGMLYGGSNRLSEAIAAFGKAVELSPQTEAYQRNLQLAKTRIGTGERVRFRVIEAKTRAAAETIRRKLQSGLEWDALARDYSIHPSSRSQNPILEAGISEIEPLFAKSLVQMKSGQISEVIDSGKGFFLLRKE